MAAGENSTQCVEVLLSRGADINAKNNVSNNSEVEGGKVPEESAGGGGDCGEGDGGNVTYYISALKDLIKLKYSVKNIIFEFSYNLYFFGD